MQATVLRRMIRQRDQMTTDNPLTSSRAVRLALTKAAHDAIGLVLTVTSVAENEADLDAMLDGLSDDLMMVGLLRDGQLAGLATLDAELRAAVVEMQTVGALIDAAAPERTATNTDAFLSLPVLDAFLAAFPTSVRGTTLEGWGDDITADTRIPDRRTAGLVLTDRLYRSVQLNVDLGVADRQGALQIILPHIAVQSAIVAGPDRLAEWGPAFQDSVLDAPTVLDALLHRFDMSLADLRDLTVGTVVPLPGCSVSSVRLLAPGGAPVARARLGQMGGKRAVRLETPPAAQMAELATGHAADPMPQAIAADPMMDAPAMAEVDVAEDDFPAMNLDIPLGDSAIEDEGG